MSSNGISLPASPENADLIFPDERKNLSADIAARDQEILQTRKQLQYLHRLFQMTQSPQTDFMQALRLVLQASAKVIGAQHCIYWRFDDGGGQCVLDYDESRQTFDSDPANSMLLAQSCLHLHDALRESPVLAIPDVERDSHAESVRDYLHARAVRAALLAPAKRSGKIEGMLIVADLRGPRQWRRDELDFAVTVSAMISMLQHEADRDRHEEQLRHLAHHDSLTGLPNRHYLQYQAHDIFPKTTADLPSLAAFFIDLDGFKNVNDSIGHAIGDELLKAAARRLKNAVRENDILVRLGGDEFMLLARDLSQMRVAEDIAQKIVEVMRDRFSINGHELRISASVGIAFYPHDGSDLDTLMKKADMAMYQAKAAGRDRYQLFKPVLLNSSSDRLALQVDLRHAIERNQLEYYYQPQVDLRTGKVDCVEAFLRWRHPTRGMLMPTHFIPVAEDAGLIGQISAWMFNRICRQMGTWRARGFDDFHIAINLSASQLADRTLLPLLKKNLARNCIPASCLEWEIKESAVLQDDAATDAVLGKIAEMNICLTIDDFGTGYSSMLYLQRYSVRKIKIDPSLVSGLPDQLANCAMADAIISMAHPLGLSVVAEGVETPQQIEYLRMHGCDFAQGYYFSHPMSLGQFETWLIHH